MEIRLGTLLLLLTLCPAGALAADYAAGDKAYAEKRYREAYALWTTAAERGDIEAIYSLGKMHGEGVGVLQDYVEAHALFNVAAARGHEQALVGRQLVEQRMTQQEQSAARTLAKQYFARFPETAGSGTPAAAQSSGGESGRSKRLVIAGYVPLYKVGDPVWGSDTEMITLQRRWVDMNTSMFESILGDAHGWALIKVAKNTARVPNAAAASALCAKHSADAILLNRFAGVRGNPNHNWQREMELWSYDCASGATQRQRYAHQAGNLGWNFGEMKRQIAAFARRSQILEE